MKKLLSLSLLSTLVLAGCATTAINKTDFESAYNTINSEQLTTHIKAFASDEFGGRGPSTEGEKDRKSVV